MKNIFTIEVTNEIIARIEQLESTSQPLWGKMSVAKMLAHCCVTYEMVYTDKHAKPPYLLRLLLKWVVKKSILSDKPYPKNNRTVKQYVISKESDFDKEKERLIAYIRKTQKLGLNYFEGKESNLFGKLTGEEWSLSFYKHLDHHLKQFGV